MKKPIYNAIFLDDKSIKDLAFVLNNGKHSKKFIHHVTLEFRPDDIHPMDGKEVDLEVLAHYSDDRGECITVKLDDQIQCTNENPHITISTIQEESPVYSNELIKNSTPTPEKGVWKLKGTIGSFYG